MSSLPANPSLENLKKQAKTLKKSWLEGDVATLERVRKAHPKYANDEELRAAKPRLTDCQLVLAREAGFDSWPQLRVAVEAANKELPEQFVTIACLCYDDPHYDHRSFHAGATEMLQQNPWLAEANIWSAATAGNAAAVKSFLDENASLVNRPGPHGWAPLICACYSRVQPTLDVAKVLLERGADPNAFTMKGNADERLDQTGRRFTALTGLFGGGSTGMANQPPHPQWRELAELLLDHGADPTDEMALMINQEGNTYGKLEILARHGAKPEGLGTSLSRAVLNGDTESVKLLLAHHANTSKPFRGKTPWQYAMQRGHLHIARLLEEAGAPTTELDDVQRFVTLCLAGDEQGVRAMLERAPDLLARAPKYLVNRAADAGRAEAINLVIDLGFDPNYMDEVVPLHIAAGSGNEEIVRLLMKRGALPSIREPFYDATPVGWADFFDRRHMRDLMLDEGAICLFDALDYDRLDRVPDILARDPEALNRPFAKCITREPRPEDWQTPLARMMERGKTEAVRLLKQYGASSQVSGS
jgi:ankyrin repeat protein